MRQAVILGLCFGVLCAMMVAPPLSGQSGEIVMISYAGPSQEPHRFYLVEPFQQAHPGLTVRLVPDEAGEYVARVQAALAACRGKVGLTSTSSNLGLGFLVAAAKMNGGDEANLEPAWQAIRSLQPFVIAPNPTALAQLFEREEIVIAPLWSTDAAVLASKGLPIKFVKPQPGAIAIVSFLSIIKGSQFTQIAHELLNRVLSVEYQSKAAARPYFFGPTNVKVAVPPEAADYIPTTLNEIRRLQTVNWPVIVPVRAAIVERWNREFAR